MVQTLGKTIRDCILKMTTHIPHEPAFGRRYPREMLYKYIIKDVHKSVHNTKSQKVKTPQMPINRRMSK